MQRHYWMITTFIGIYNLKKPNYRKLCLIFCSHSEVNMILNQKSSQFQLLLFVSILWVYQNLLWQQSLSYERKVR